MLSILRARGTGGITAVGSGDRGISHGDRHMKQIELKKYEAKIENGQIVHYAITKDGERIRMPDAFKNMYTDKYLMIRETTSEMPEVLGVPKEPFWIPIRTDMS